MLTLTDNGYFDMKDLPVIFHKNIICEFKKFNFINWHENIEIIRIVNGEGVILCGEKSIAVKKNDVVIINANNPHGFIGNDNMENELKKAVILTKHMLSKRDATAIRQATQNLTT